ncbi:MAG: hypothetical protein K2Y22_03235 [Candidatus Obscuribacterales bacterium]|nr:hypothetical protein [Candidatus Obscuribacterales bacterium]
MPESVTERHLPGFAELAGDMHACSKELSCGKSKPGPVTAPEAFYLCDSRSVDCAELGAAGVFDLSERLEQPLERAKDEVKSLVIRESSNCKDSIPANFRIDSDGTIKEIRDPSKKMTDSDSVLSIEMMNGSLGEGNAYSEKQKAALRQLISYVQANWSVDLPLDECTQDPQKRILSAVFSEPNTDETNVSTDITEWPKLPKVDARIHIWEKPQWHLFDSAEGRQCGEYDRVDQMPDDQRAKFIDRVKKLISRNEGGYTTIALNDNGYGISVGIAQWNQKKGELPKLLKAWFDASEAEREGQLPELFKGWRKAAESNLQDPPVKFGPAVEPNRFERIFGVHSQTLLDEKSVREYPFTDDTDEAKDMMRCLKEALRDDLFCHVQDELVRNNVRRAIILADKYAHHSTRFIAQVADVANQYGWGGCESYLRKANVANIPEDVEGECMAIQAFIDNTPPKTNTKTGEPIYRTERDKRLDKEFPPKNASSLRLMTKDVF